MIKKELKKFNFVKPKKEFPDLIYIDEMGWPLNSVFPETTNGSWQPSTIYTTTTTGINSFTNTHISPGVGAVIWNSELNRMEFWDGQNWVPLHNVNIA